MWFSLLFAVCSLLLAGMNVLCVVCCGLCLCVVFRVLFDVLVFVVC